MKWALSASITNLCVLFASIFLVVYEFCSIFAPAKSTDSNRMPRWRNR